jgi:Lhr-like helicase
MINLILDSIEQYFYNLTTHQPYNFQTQTITRILNRQDTILRAPTGSGKTETAIAPFLFAKTLNFDFPNKLIYVVPLRTLANSLRQRAEILIDRWSQVLVTGVKTLTVTKFSTCHFYYQCSLSFPLICEFQTHCIFFG